MGRESNPGLRVPYPHGGQWGGALPLSYPVLRRTLPLAGRKRQGATFPGRSPEACYQSRFRRTRSWMVERSNCHLREWAARTRSEHASPENRRTPAAPLRRSAGRAPRPYRGESPFLVRVAPVGNPVHHVLADRSWGGPESNRRPHQPVHASPDARPRPMCSGLLSYLPKRGARTRTGTGARSDGVRLPTYRGSGEPSQPLGRRGGIRGPIRLPCSPGRSDAPRGP